MLFWIPTFVLGFCAGVWLARELRQRHLHRWLGSYLMQAPRRREPRPDEEVHLLLCLADHFEPCEPKRSLGVSRSILKRWAADYPRLFGRFRDSDGRPPRHTFFYPMEMYDPEFFEPIVGLCRAGYGEVEVHLHHADDTPENLRARLLEYRDILAGQYGLLGRRRDNGEPAYAFIHGNWSLNNSHPDGIWCGVDHELGILRETGCFVDMTYPSAPHPTQPPIINTIYYASDRPGRRCAHHRGVPVGAVPQPPGSLMLIPGPLLLDWSHRKAGVLPRLENACLQNSQPPSRERLKLWLRARVQVPSRPDWFFVKLHAHGCADPSMACVLGEPLVRFHEELAALARENPHFHFHYVSAREMYNLARAAEAGFEGSVADARDWEIQPPPFCVPSADALPLPVTDTIVPVTQ
jgi:hypothetical protein